MTKKLIIIFTLLQLALMGVMFGVGFITREIIDKKEGVFPVLLEAYHILDENALEPLPSTTQMEYAMIRGLLQSYGDRYTIFVEPPQHELQSDTLEGKYGGIGTRLERDINGDYLLFPYPESPAERAGIRDGDILVKVGNLVAIHELALEEVEAALRGKVGSKVEIQIKREGSVDSLSFIIKREDIPIPSVTWNIVPGYPEIGLVKVSVIAEPTPDELADAINSLQDKGAKYFILDLRDNSGGLVESGVNMARLFLREGIVIEQKYRGKPTESFKVVKQGIFSDIPLVVLCNHGTASASEIIAGALQGQKRSLLIGSQSYGKDTIQLVFTLQDESSIHVTAARWWVPGFEHQSEVDGLMPDILLSDEQANGAEAIQEAVRILSQP